MEQRNADVQWANIPFLPLREKEAERFVLYGVLSLLKRILVGASEKNTGSSNELTHIAVDAMDYVLWR
jgi:hypothetical protein